MINLNLNIQLYELVTLSYTYAWFVVFGVNEAINTYSNR